MQQIQSSFRVDLKKEKSTFFISSQTISVTIVASWNRCEGKGGIESLHALQMVATNQGTLTLILKGEVSVQLTSTSLLVRTRLF